MDCETFTDTDEIIKIYCLGFKTSLNDEPLIYYTNNEINSHGIVPELI